MCKTTERNLALVGQTFISGKYGKFTITQYKSNKEVHIRFENTGGIKVTNLYQVQSGGVFDPLAKTCYGVGYVGYGYDKKCQCSQRLYKIWSGVLQRAYDPLWKERYTAYQETICDSSFLCASTFIKWAKLQKGYNSLDDLGRPFALDKDILSNNVSQYSPNNCVFVPVEINNLLLNNKVKRGTLPLGVSFRNGKYRARVSVNGKESYLGHYDTETEAFQVYKQAKEQQVKVVAEKWKHEIDSRVYDALMKWEVNQDD